MSAGYKTIILTLLLAGSLYLKGNSRVQLWDRDEPRYAQCSRQMLESGDWVVPRLYDKLRFQKPPLIYWCQATAMKLLGSQGDEGAFSARLPSVVSMLLTLVLLAVVISKHAGHQQASWTVFVFATSAMAIVSAKTCLTDGVLIFFVVAAQLCAYAIWRGNRSWTIFIVLGLALGFGILAKGPFIVGIIATTAGVLLLFRWFERWNWWRKDASLSPTAPVATTTAIAASPFAIFLQVLVATLIVVAMVYPWIHLVRHRAPDFLPAMFHEGKQHALEGKEGHNLPPGYHFAVVWAMFMPWSLLLPLAIGMGFRNRHVPEIRFALAAVFGPWLMVECMGTKLPHYFLPAYPAMAYLVAFSIRRCLKGDSQGVESKGFFIGAGIWTAGVIAVAGAPWISVRYFHPGHLDDMIGLTIICVAFGLLVFFLLRTRRLRGAFIAMGIGMAVSIGGAMDLFANADYLRISTWAADMVVGLHATHPGDAKMVDYKEPSLAFYQGGTIREVEKKADLITKPIDQWPRVVVITREAWNMTPIATRNGFVVIDTRRGWAYADQMRVVEVMVVEKVYTH